MELSSMGVQSFSQTPQAIKQKAHRWMSVTSSQAVGQWGRIDPPLTTVCCHTFCTLSEVNGVRLYGRRHCLLESQHLERSRQYQPGSFVTLVSFHNGRRYYIYTTEKVSNQLPSCEPCNNAIIICLVRYAHWCKNSVKVMEG